MTQNFFESSVTSFFQSAPLGSSFSPGSSSSTCPSSSPVATTLLGRGGFTAQMEKAFPYFFSASPQASPAARRSADEARGGGEEGKKSCGSRETHDCPGEALRHAREAGSGCGREAAALLRDAKSALDKVCRQSGQWSVLREAGCPRGDDEGRQFEKHFTCSSLASPLTTFEGERELPPARAAAAAGLTFSSPSPAQFFSAESPFPWAPSLPPSAPQAAPFASASPGLGGVNAPGRLARPPLASALSAVAALSQDLDAAEQRETAAASGLFSKRPFQAEREGSSVGCEAFPSLYSAAERESPAPPQGQPPARRPAFPSLVVGASLCARAGDARAAAGRETSTAFIPDARLLHGGDLCAFPAAASQDIPRGGARGGDAGGPREERNGVFRGARGVSARFLPPARPLGGGGDDPRHAFFVDQMCEGEGELRFTHFFAGEPPADAPREGSLPLAALSASSSFSHAQGSPPRAFASFLSLSGHAADRLNL
ncbi:hypothetical protein BESB_001680 [Besnoitia besnoiti]|uniref:Uncharacterized protein n=1 Tax=Besnoitia besnoiti TaxID=94643 RepID=A0A2A9MNL7_BESBE|nr:hypothetical protein BESB_001680 [Besnoitia besnoiti]PFH37826.1 hypothetical protein BESB_001680 [Besnoitia besnoiti]